MSLGAEDKNITVATCQHAVSGEVAKNLDCILSQIKEAKSRRADIVHFSECNLTGYGGIDFFSYEATDYEQVLLSMELIKKLAKALNIHVIIGSHHFIENVEKPKNSLLYINSNGDIEARYDKRILAGTEGTKDHLYYSHGDKPVVFDINGIKCGMLICHEWRYAELYREYKKMGVELLFHSWYDGGLNKRDYEKEGILTGELILGATRGNAANNYLWISGSNTCRKESCYPSFVVQPDGRVLNELTRNEPGVLISKIDLNKKYDDPSFYGRNRFL